MIRAHVVCGSLHAARRERGGVSKRRGVGMGTAKQRKEGVLYNELMYVCMYVCTHTLLLQY